MPNLEKMDIDDLERYREKLAKQKQEIREKFMAAGEVLEIKRLDAKLAREYELLEEKRAALREKMGKEPEETKSVGLRKWFGG